MAVYLVDHSPDGGIGNYVAREFREMHVLRGDESMWWTAATNSGIRKALAEAADGDYILTLNNDVVLAADFSCILLNEIDNFPRALIGSLALDEQYRSRIVEAGVHINWLVGKFTYNLKDRSVDELKSSGDSCYRPTVLPGRGTAIPAKVFKEIGLFDSNAFPHYAADYDFSLRARKAGYDLVVSYGLRLWCFPKLSGIADTGERVPIGHVLRSFFSIRSGNNLATRFRFAIRHAPRLLLPTFLIADTIRVIFGTFLKRTRLW
jgi:GT2 family glycosyltransferase